MNGRRKYSENRCESVAGCGYFVKRYSESLRTSRNAMTRHCDTSMPFIPANMLMLFGQNIAMLAM